MRQTEHQPFFYQNDNPMLAMCVHGYMGSPVYFAGWTEQLLAQGYDCKGLLLPGHGEEPKRFSRATAEEWIGHVRGEVAQAAAQYDGILMLGHSMGGLLSLLMAAEEKKIKGVFALNPAVGFHFRPASLSKYAGLLLGKPERDSEKRREIRSQVSVELTGLLDAGHYVRPMKQLYKLVARLPAAEEKITCPVLLFHGKKDETVSGRAIAKLCSRLPEGEEVVLPDSTHEYYPASDRRIIAASLKKFAARVNPGQT